MIQFALSEAPAGASIATHGGETRQGSDPARTIARELVEAGAPDQPWEMTRDGRPVMTGRSLHWLAATRIGEGDAGFTRGWFAPHPNSPPRPALEAVIARCRAEAAERKVGRAGTAPGSLTGPGDGG